MNSYINFYVGEVRCYLNINQDNGGIEPHT